MMNVEPCQGAQLSVQIVIGALAGLNTILATWLANRRRRADNEHRRFREFMLHSNGLSTKWFDEANDARRKQRRDR